MFYDFSHGFRPGRSPQQALETFWPEATGLGVRWVLEVDSRKYFDKVLGRKLDGHYACYEIAGHGRSREAVRTGTQKRWYQWRRRRRREPGSQTWAWMNRMRESRSSGSVGEPVGNHRLYPEGCQLAGLTPLRCSARKKLKTVDSAASRGHIWFVIEPAGDQFSLNRERQENSFPSFMKKLMTMFAAMTLTVVAVANTASALDSWSFVMLGDTRDGDSTTNGVSPYLNAMAHKIATLNPRPQFVVVAGDLCNGNCLNTNSSLYPTNGNFSSEAMKEIYAKFFTNWKTAMQPVFDYSTDTGIPIYPMRGNHENQDNGLAPIEVLKRAYLEAFSRYVPTNGPNHSPTNDQRGLSWAFTHSNVTFVAADQYFNFDPTMASNTTPWSGYHTLDQSWVTQQLRGATSPYKIFISHEPIFQVNGDDPPSEPYNEGAQHFFGISAAALQTRSNFWNDIGDAGAQVYLCGHLHLETVAATTNGHGHTIIQLMAGNGGAPPQQFIDKPEPGVTTLYNNGNTLVTNGTNVSIQGTFGFSLATVQEDKMTIRYYSFNPTNQTTNVWTVADYVTEIASPIARPVILMPFDPRTGIFSYIRMDPAGTGLSYRVYTSPDLRSTWNVDAAATQTVTATTNKIQTVQVTLSGPKPLTATKLFIRIVAQ
jgi:hypothetical protein